MRHSKATISAYDQRKRHQQSSFVAKYYWMMRSETLEKVKLFIKRKKAYYPTAFHKANYSCNSVTSLAYSDVVQSLLIIAGDIEVNPGPLHPGLLKRLLKDLEKVRNKYVTLGLKLEIPLCQIQAFEKYYRQDPTRIFAEVINFWLSDYSKEDYVELFCNSLKEIVCLSSNYSKDDYIKVLCNALKEMDENCLADHIKDKFELQQRLLKHISKDLKTVEKKYSSVGLELEVPLTQIHIFECKYPGDIGRIFAEVLNYWLSNYSKEDYVEVLCNALKEINELCLEEYIRNKYGLNKDPVTDKTTDFVGEAVAMSGLEEPESLVSKCYKVEGEPQGRDKVLEGKPQGRDEVVEGEPQGRDEVVGEPQARDEVVEGVPQGRDVVVEGKPQDRDEVVELEILCPASVPTQNLDGLKDTMTAQGDTDYPLTNSNTKWQDIKWIIEIQHDLEQRDNITADDEDTVVVKMDVVFRIVPIFYSSIVEQLSKGVKNYVKKALKEKYEVYVKNTDK